MLGKSCENKCFSFAFHKKRNILTSFPLVLTSYIGNASLIDLVYSLLFLSPYMGPRVTPRHSEATLQNVSYRD